MICLKEETINKNDYIRYISTEISDRYKHTVTHEEKEKVMLSLARRRTIALVEYDCCGNVNSTNNKRFYRGEDNRKHNLSSSQHVNNKPIFEDIV